MSKHTRGPWVVREERDSRFDRLTALRISEPEEGRAIANVNYMAFPLGEAEANARLVAAAPDLLAALEVLLADYDAYLDYESQRSDTSEEEAIAERARATIAKAKGESL